MLTFCVSGKMSPPFEEALTRMTESLGLQQLPGQDWHMRGRGNSKFISPPHSRSTRIIGQAMRRFFVALNPSFGPRRDFGVFLAKQALEHTSPAVRTAFAVDSLRYALTFNVSEDAAQRLRGAVGGYPEGTMYPDKVKQISQAAKAVTYQDNSLLGIFFEQSLVGGVADSQLWRQVEQEMLSKIQDGAGGDRGIGFDHSEGHLTERDSDREPHKGLTLPGYNYVGPGNPLDNGPPQGPVDEAAKHHDERYEELLSHGDIPYLKGHGADELMTKELISAEEDGKISNPVDSVVSNAARALWEGKKVVNQALDPLISQVLPVDPPQSSGELPNQEAGNLDRDSFPEGGPSPKKARIGDSPFDVELPSPEPARTAPVPSTPATAMAASANAGPVETRGAGGVRIKAEWLGGTEFTESTIVTRHTRISLITDRGGYVPIYQDGVSSLSQLPAIGMKTPYSYIDVNALSSHFTPRDFQQLIDEYQDIRPKALRIKITGLVIKDVSRVNGTTTVTDSPSGVLNVFADEEYEYPYVMGHNQDTIPGHLPGEHYVLPQYAYFSRGLVLEGSTSRKIIDDHNTSLYFLEHHDAECLNTGEIWSHEYTFPDSLPKRKLSTPAQSFFARHNPLISSRMAVMTGVDNDGVAKWERHNGMQIGFLPQNHIPGPSVNLPIEGQIHKAQWNRAVAIGDAETDFRYNVCPLVNQPLNTIHWDDKGNQILKNSVGSYAYTRRRHEESYEGYPEEQGGIVKNPSIPLVPSDNVIGITPGDSFLVPGKEAVDSSLEPGNINYNSKLYALPIMPLLPGACWNPTPLSYDVQIWCKTPDTECKFFEQFPLMGGWSVENPPPMIFVRLRVQPGPPPEGAHTVSGDSLGQYAFFNLHYEMEWEVTRRTRTKRHNPEKPAAYPVTVSGRAPYTLSKLPSETTAKYEVPQHQWMAYNFSKLL